VTVEEFEAFLTQRGCSFTTKDIDHGVQIKVATGETVQVYNTGSVTVGGKKSALKQELEVMGQTGFVPAPTGEDGEAQAPGPGLNKKVFVVYGHDTVAREKLELILLKMGMEPIVLANLPAAGDTIIEKLEKYLKDAHGVGFACVLLTPDDEGYRAGAAEEKKYRARQNVILELGMVLSRLSRKRVAILYKESVEKPSDIDGLLYLPYKENLEEIKTRLFKELQEAGYTPAHAAL
jgi:predicted nucleotide-binding protein